VPAEVRDFPGFVSNRILMPFINEAAYALMEGVAEPDAIDTIARLGFAHPLGPLALADLIASRSWRSCTKGWATSGSRLARSSAST
jgi:3-hydroxyacyl-CoA dehydrogenase